MCFWHLLRTSNNVKTIDDYKRKLVRHIYDYKTRTNLECDFNSEFIYANMTDRDLYDAINTLVMTNEEALILRMTRLVYEKRFGLYKQKYSENTPLSEKKNKQLGFANMKEINMINHSINNMYVYVSDGIIHLYNCDMVQNTKNSSYLFYGELYNYYLENQHDFRKTKICGHCKVNNPERESIITTAISK